MQNNENDLLFKRSDTPHIIVSSTNVSSYASVISEIESDIEHVMFFNSGVKADFVESIKPYDARFSNFLGLYTPDINDAFSLVRSMTIELCKHYDINYKRSAYYMSSDYMRLDSEFWYDGGGVRIPAYNGFIIVECEKDTELKVSGITKVVNPGDVLMFEAGHRVSFGNSNNLVISFSIAPLSMINGQYPNKWIPL